MKKICILLFVLVIALISGCSIPGSSGMPVEDDSVTIKGTVNAPTVLANGLLAATGTENSPDAFTRFVANSSCMINNTSVVFSLSSATRELTIEKIPPAAAYHVELKCGGLRLRAFAPGGGRNVTLPLGMSLRSTADWHIRDAVASAANIAGDQLTGYDVKSDLIDALVTTMQNELKKTTATAASYETSLKNASTGLLTGREFADCMQQSGAQFSYNGKFSATVFYYACNASGKAVLAVQALATLICTQAGSSVSGSLNIEPKAVVPLVEEPGINSPTTTAFSFTGTVNASFLTFTRKGTLGPLAGKNLDSWFIFPVRGGLAVKATNLDTAYFSGVTARPGEFLLAKQ